MTVYIIEHLEKELWPWCLIEYEQISKTVGRNKLWFTNIKRKDIRKLRKFGKVFVESIKNMKFEKSCVLDPAARHTLKTSDKNMFDYFIFGGILGDNPPRKRTGPELTRFILHAGKRNIGKEQFSTDNAVYVVHEILRGKKLKDMKFADGIEIEMNDVESVGLPYRYPLVNGKPRISSKLVNYLKKNPRI